MKTTTLIISAFFLFHGVMGQTSGSDDRKLVPVVSTNNHTEFSPTISADGRTLIFESQRGDKWELYESQQNAKGEWTEPVALKVINDKCHFIAGPSLSYDGNTLFYTAFIEEVTKSEDIFYSVRLSENQWSEPKSIGSPINTDESYEGFPSISSDGNDLYFIRVNDENGYDKKAKEICFKIYLSHKQTDGSWGIPEPLPEVVNSGCERDPRIMADNHTLIFSSIRLEGKGKYDLYQTQLQHDGSWGAVSPLAFINSADNDQSPCISASGLTMFYYSKDDIYEISIPKEFRQMINVTVQGIVGAGKNNTPVKAKIAVKNLDTGETFISESNTTDGRYTLVLAAGKGYEVEFSNPDYLPEKLSLDYRSQQTYLEKKLNVTLSDSFTVLLTTEDKDLKRPVRAYVKLTADDGTVVFADSVKGDLPKGIELLTNKAYEMGVWAPGYMPVQKQIKFGGEYTQKEVRDVEVLEYEKVQVVAQVTDITSGSKKKLKVTYRNETTDEVIIADAGEVVNLRKGDRYQIVTNSDKGYTYSIKTVVAGEGAAEKGAFNVSLPVTGLVTGARLNLNHIYFETDSWKLSESSAFELNTIVQLLKDNPNVTIEISAHTDNVGTDEYNNDLSLKRALSVTEYLNEKGIPIRQLVAKGYGKTRHIAANETDEDKAKNRRVELLVMKVD